MEIKNRHTGEVIYKSRHKTIKATVEAAVKAGADLWGADLGCANLGGAYLGNAKLIGADLVDANLGDANLGDANLTGARLVGANLIGAGLAGADLGDADGIIEAGAPNGWTTIGWQRDGYLSIRVGCRDKRLDEARAYWSKSHANWGLRQEIPPALDYIEAVARLRGWPITEEDKNDA